MKIMKYIFLLNIILNFSIILYGQCEIEIYQKVFKEYISNNNPPSIDYSQPITYILVNRPVYMPSKSKNDYTYFKGKYIKLEQQTFLSFVEKNKDPLLLENLQFFGNYEIITVDTEYFEKALIFYSKYPNWNGSVIELSNIGFNYDKRQALVYYGFNRGPGVGAGFYIIYEKKGKKWKQKAVIPSWST